jgi:hypothetical protein
VHWLLLCCGVRVPDWFHRIQLCEPFDHLFSFRFQYLLFTCLDRCLSSLEPCWTLFCVRNPLLGTPYSEAALHFLSPVGCSGSTCTAGMFSSGGNMSCTVCAAGAFAASSGLSACAQCASGASMIFCTFLRTRVAMHTSREPIAFCPTLHFFPSVLYKPLRCRHLSKLDTWLLVFVLFGRHLSRLVGIHRCASPLHSAGLGFVKSLSAGVTHRRED